MLWPKAVYGTVDISIWLKTKGTESMLMLKKDTERRNQLGFQLDTFGMDLSKYIFSDD